jgi:hypothetical protein
MNESFDDSELARVLLLFAHGDEAGTAAVEKELTARGWIGERPRVGPPPVTAKGRAFLLNHRDGQ